MRICDQFAKKDHVFMLFIKSNGGVVKARAIGIAASTGEYICFVDSDDSIDTSMIEDMIESILRDSTDGCLMKIG